MPSPLSPPQMAKFQLAPCQRPPMAMVSITLMLVVSQSLNVGTACAMPSTTNAKPPNPTRIQKFPAMAAIINTIENSTT